MGSILKYDRVVLIKEFGKMKMVGEVYEVANITETAFVLRDAKNKVAVGAINIKDLEEYFKKEEEVSGWTPWTPVLAKDGSIELFYRTNHKKVQVRLVENGIKGESSCNTIDDFNLYFGIKLAYTRLRTKLLKDNKKLCEDNLKAINSEIKENEKYMKQMVDSLKKEEE